MRGIDGIILAGGQGSRMNNQDKGLIPWRGTLLIQQVLQCFTPQVDNIVISCNRHLEQYRALGHQVCRDNHPDFQGPLAGIEACLDLCETAHVAICSCDTPLLPSDQVTRLQLALTEHDADVAYVDDGHRHQYLLAVLKTDLRDSLRDYLSDGGRSVRGWYKNLNTVSVDFSNESSTFVNINTLEQLQ